MTMLITIAMMNDKSFLESRALFYRHTEFNRPSKRKFPAFLHIVLVRIGIPENDDPGPYEEPGPNEDSEP